MQMFEIVLAGVSVSKVRGTMMIKRAVLGLSAALALFASPANAATNLVSNGSFEFGINPGSFTTVTAFDNSSIVDWTVGSGSIDYIGSYWLAQDGARSIDLAGNALGTISQTLTTAISQAYTVNFWASKNPDGGAPTRTGTVTFNGVPMTFQYSAANSLTNMMWQQYSYTFVATGTSTLLSFAADISAGCCYGPALDNVSVAAVPEPEAWAMMLLGFGAIGFQMRRRKKLRTVLA